MPLRTLVEPALGAGEPNEAPSLQPGEQPVALRPAPVEVHHDVRGARPRGQHGAFMESAHGHDVIDYPQCRQPAAQGGWCRQDQAGAGPCPVQAPECSDRCEQVPEPESPQDQHVGHGQDGSVDEATTSSRTSQPGGCCRAINTLAATSSGSLSGASGPGRYCSVRPSKNRVRMPPGTRRVTPTRPASSVASARVNPKTPNFDAQ